MEPTSNSEPKSAPTPTYNTSSGDYLATQINDAKRALESTLDDLKLDVARAADLRRWIRRYPWAAVGTALVAGFTAAHLLKSNRRGKESADQLTVDEITRAAEIAAVTTPPRKTTARPEAAAGLRGAVINTLFEILKLAITQLINASVRAANSHPANTRTSAAPDESAAKSQSAADADARDGSRPISAEAESRS